LCVFLIFLVVINGVAIHQNRNQRRVNNAVGEGLDLLISETHAQLTKNQKLVERARTEVASARNLIENIHLPDHDGLGPIPEMGSATMLSTLITVLIKKYGSTHLGLSDFISVGDEEFVSVYVDAGNGDVILSIDPALTEDASSSMINFTDFDDKTYN